jgi:hypothetical protein
LHTLYIDRRLLNIVPDECRTVKVIFCLKIL